ncbi:PHP-associated domain-containing protein, partial [Patescibacteria group bacterium]
NIDLFDAIELTVFSNRLFGFNKSATKVAKKYNKPLIATADAHTLEYLKRGYTLIESEEKTPSAIFKAIKNGHLENKTTAMSLITMAGHKTHNHRAWIKNLFTSD